MRKLFFTAFALISSFVSVAQVDSTSITENKAGTVYTIVEEMPEFPGGKAELFRYLVSNIVYPKKAKAEGAEGVVYVGFLVDKDGSIQNAKVLRGVHHQLDSVAVAVVESMPKWKPGVQRGKAVKVRYNLPIKYSLNKEGEEN